MSKQKIWCLAIRIRDMVGESRQKADRYNHEYLEYWRSYYSR
jgi:hypothetical protein